ncbi:MAG: SO_0444 family Cu/Zn efflux transporter [Ectothiorhodospiraceae bacterium]|nr:SO_0444 family Cu/Zn efflux transporter [Ectothiorhodospiraceae bacterium]
MNIVHETVAVALTAAPWLLLGLFAAGLVKAYFPERLLSHWVSGRGIGGVSRAAVIGAPLPLCSCGAIPTALALHRAGAGRGPTAAFMIGSPGVGVDSVAITYALLGPFMALVRAAGAVITAIGTGLLVATTDVGTRGPAQANTAPSDACTDACDRELPTGQPVKGQWAEGRLRHGMRYAFAELLDDISLWILGGLIIAGILMALVPPQAMAAYGSGLLPMLLLAVIGIPLYVCASAATPIAAGMLAAGISPGTALVFLLAGPITSMATLALLWREMGTAALACYLGGIIGSVVVLGLALDGLIAWLDISIAAQIGTVREFLPHWLEWPALVLLAVLATTPLRRGLGRLVPAPIRPRAG